MHLTYVWLREVAWCTQNAWGREYGGGEDPYIKMGSAESHFSISLTVRDKVTRQCPQTMFFEEKGEPKWIQTEVPLLTSLTPDR